MEKDFKFDFNPGESVIVSTADEAKIILDYLADKGVRLSSYLLTYRMNGMFENIVKGFGRIGRLESCAFEVSAITKMVKSTSISFEEYEERFINEHKNKKEGMSNMNANLVKLNYSDWCKIKDNNEYNLIRTAARICGIDHQDERGVYVGSRSEIGMGFIYLAYNCCGDKEKEVSFEEMIIKIFKGEPRLAVRGNQYLKALVSSSAIMNSDNYEGGGSGYYFIEGNTLMEYETRLERFEDHKKYLVVSSEIFESIHRRLTKEENPKEMEKLYSIPKEILDGISELTSTQIELIKEYGININVLDPKATENQIQYVYSIICNNWKLKFAAAFPDIFGIGSEVVDSINAKELNIASNGLLQRRNSGSYAKRGFYLNPTFRGIKIKWEIIIDDRGCQVLMSKKDND